MPNCTNLAIKHMYAAHWARTKQEEVRQMSLNKWQAVIVFASNTL